MGTKHSKRATQTVVSLQKTENMYKGKAPVSYKNRNQAVSKKGLKPYELTEENKNFIKQADLISTKRSKLTSSICPAPKVDKKSAVVKFGFSAKPAVSTLISDSSSESLNSILSEVHEKDKANSNANIVERNDDNLNGKAAQFNTLEVYNKNFRRNGINDKNSNFCSNSNKNTSQPKISNVRCKNQINSFSKPQHYRNLGQNLNESSNIAKSHSNEIKNLNKVRDNSKNDYNLAKSSKKIGSDPWIHKKREFMWNSNTSMSSLDNSFKSFQSVKSKEKYSKTGNFKSKNTHETRKSSLKFSSLKEKAEIIQSETSIFNKSSKSSKSEESYYKRPESDLSYRKKNSPTSLKKVPIVAIENKNAEVPFESSFKLNYTEAKPLLTQKLSMVQDFFSNSNYHLNSGHKITNLMNGNKNIGEAVKVNTQTNFDEQCKSFTESPLTTQRKELDNACKISSSKKRYKFPAQKKRDNAISDDFMSPNDIDKNGYQYQTPLGSKSKYSYGKNLFSRRLSIPASMENSNFKHKQFITAKNEKHLSPVSAKNLLSLFNNTETNNIKNKNLLTSKHTPKLADFYSRLPSPSHLSSVASPRPDNDLCFLDDEICDQPALLFNDDFDDSVFEEKLLFSPPVEDVGALRDLSFATNESKKCPVENSNTFNRPNELPIQRKDETDFVISNECEALISPAAKTIINDWQTSLTKTYSLQCVSYGTNSLSSTESDASPVGQKSDSKISVSQPTGFPNKKSNIMTCRNFAKVDQSNRPLDQINGPRPKSPRNNNQISFFDQHKNQFNHSIPNDQPNNLFSDQSQTICDQSHSIFDQSQANCDQSQSNCDQSNSIFDQSQIAVCHKTQELVYDQQTGKCDQTEDQSQVLSDQRQRRNENSQCHILLTLGKEQLDSERNEENLTKDKKDYIKNLNENYEEVLEMQSLLINLQSILLGSDSNSIERNETNCSNFREINEINALHFNKINGLNEGKSKNLNEINGLSEGICPDFSERNEIVEVNGNDIECNLNFERSSPNSESSISSYSNSNERNDERKNIENEVKKCDCDKMRENNFDLQRQLILMQQSLEEKERIISQLQKERKELFRKANPTSCNLTNLKIDSNSTDPAISNSSINCIQNGRDFDSKQDFLFKNNYCANASSSIKNDANRARGPVLSQNGLIETPFISQNGSIETPFISQNGFIETPFISQNGHSPHPDSLKNCQKFFNAATQTEKNRPCVSNFLLAGDRNTNGKTVRYSPNSEVDSLIIDSDAEEILRNSKSKVHTDEFLIESFSNMPYESSLDRRCESLQNHASESSLKSVPCEQCEGYVESYTKSNSCKSYLGSLAKYDNCVSYVDGLVRSSTCDSSFQNSLKNNPRENYIKNKCFRSFSETDSHKNNFHILNNFLESPLENNFKTFQNGSRKKRGCESPLRNSLTFEKSPNSPCESLKFFSFLST